MCKFPVVDASSDVGHICACVYAWAMCMHTYSSVCCRLKPPVLVNIHHPHCNLFSPAELKLAGGGWRRDLPRGPLGTPSPRGSFPSFLESSVIGLSLAKFPPVFHPQKGGLSLSNLRVRGPGLPDSQKGN